MYTRPGAEVVGTGTHATSVKGRASLKEFTTTPVFHGPSKKRPMLPAAQRARALRASRVIDAGNRVFCSLNLRRNSIALT